jgi:hypothetical protein
MRDKARHIVTVKRPKANFGSVGDQQGEDETIYANWPCSIETLSGNEAELARQNFPSASSVVKGYTDPKKLIQATDYLLLGSRRINVGFVNNIMQRGLEAELLCGES